MSEERALVRPSRVFSMAHSRHALSLGCVNSYDSPELWVRRFLSYQLDRACLMGPISPEGDPSRGSLEHWSSPPFPVIFHSNEYFGVLEFRKIRVGDIVV